MMIPRAAGSVLRGTGQVLIIFGTKHRVLPGGHVAVCLVSSAAEYQQGVAILFDGHIVPHLPEVIHSLAVCEELYLKRVTAGRQLGAHNMDLAREQVPLPQIGLGRHE